MHTIKGVLLSLGVIFQALAGVSTTHAGLWDGTTVYICDASEEWPPFSYYRRVNGSPGPEIIGHSVEVIDRIFTRRGIPYQLNLIPWKRCTFEVAEGNHYHMFLSGSRNPQRDQTYYVSEAYYTLNPAYLYSTENRPGDLAIAGPNDLKRYRVCGIFGYSYYLFGLTEEEVDSATVGYDLLIKKLLGGRCDLVIDRLEILQGYKSIGKNFMLHPDLAYRLVPNGPSEPFHMMFTRNAFGLKLKTIVDEGIRELQRSGELAGIMQPIQLLPTKPGLAAEEATPGEHAPRQGKP